MDKIAEIYCQDPHHTVVNFTNGSWACSCGIYSTEVLQPNLRVE